MPVTLAQAKLNTASDIDRNVIDEFIKNDYFVGALPFHDAVSPAGAGATLTYGYTRLATQRGAQSRAINSEYVPEEVTKQQFTTDLKVHGGSFQIDRVLNRLAAGAETALQLQQLIKAARARFNNLVINGDAAVDAREFDGLDKGLTGSTTEMTASGAGADWTTVATTADAVNARRWVRRLVAKLNGRPDAFLTNADGKAALETIAEWLNVGAQLVMPDFGTFDAIGGVPIIDLGEREGTADPIIPTTLGVTDIYAVRFSLADGFHGVSTVGAPLIQTYMPDFNAPGAVKTGEVEMGPVAVALKATKGAAVLRSVTVA